MSEDGGDGARFAARNPGPPGTRIEMLQQELVHTVIDREAVLHALQPINSGDMRQSRHFCRG